MKKRVLFIGGDQRTPHIAKTLQENNYEVAIYGMERYGAFPININLTTQLLPADTFILPLPATQNNTFVYAPYSANTIHLDDVISLCNSKTQLIGGKFSQSVVEKLNQNHIPYFDFIKHNNFALKNALPTAEGTIEILLQNTPYVIAGKNICVVGSGRIGKILANKLKALDCNVTLTTRNKAQYNRIETMGIQPMYTSQLCNASPFHAIINTVPAMVVDDKVIANQPKNCLIIDLASLPGGTDFEYAKKHGYKTIHALSLPGKHAPITAAQIIAEVILEYFNESE